MSSIDPVALARELRESEHGGDATPLFTGRYPGFDWEDARAIARARDRLRLDDGEELIGYKLGWTSAPMREALGIDRPNWGTLWASQIVDGTLDLSRYRHPKVEPELVYRDGQWALGLEIVDPRFPSFDFDWLDNTADNSSCAGVVTGEFVALDLDPASMEIEFTDGTEIRQGVGAAAMGTPDEAVFWLQRSLAEEGTTLGDGEIVFTGGLAAPFDIQPGHTYILTSPSLPAVAFEV